MLLCRLEIVHHWITSEDLHSRSNDAVEGIGSIYFLKRKFKEKRSSNIFVTATQED